jgi:two-component system, OmpR family, KDP operon response regulator KdpE
MNRATILVIDDEVQIRKLLDISLQSNDYNVLLAATGKEGLAVAANHKPDLVLLDLGLPDQSGHEVLKQLREWFAHPVIILSVQSGEEDIVQALDNGANDYLVKPYRTGELMARIRSLLRREVTEEGAPVIVSGALTIDLTLRKVTKDGEQVKLTATEYALMALFAKNEGRVLTHHFLLKTVWGETYVGQSQYLRVFIAQLRKKIEVDPNRPVLIVTESRIGYRFTGNE